MKKLISFFAFALLIFSVSPAFALNCKQGQSLDSDECWTGVRMERGYWESFGYHQASRGMVVVASKQALTVTGNDGYLARFSTGSSDQTVLGVLQQALSSTDTYGMALARGRGVVRTINANGSGGVASGDALAITEGATLTSRAGKVINGALPANGTVHAVGEAWIGTALEANTTENSETETYITIV